MINQEKFNLTDKRFERKFILRDLNNIEIISSLFHSKCNFIEQFPERSVNSIYFDNHRYDSVHQNLDGINDKIKFRNRIIYNINNNRFFYFEFYLFYVSKKPDQQVKEVYADVY